MSAGHIRKRGKAWSFVLELPRGADGKRRQQWRSGFATKRAAQAALTQALAEMQTGAYVLPTKLTVGEFLPRWLAAVRPQLAPNTYGAYDRALRLHLLPALGAVPLARLSALQIQEYYTDRLTRGRHDGRGGLSPRSVHQQHGVLHAALTQAVQWNLLPRSPMDGVRAPGIPKDERPTLAPPDVKRVLAALEGTPYHLPVLFALGTGMRRGEVCGLRWIDVNLERGHAQVRQALQFHRGEGLRFALPKQNSQRQFRLSPILVLALREQQGRQAEDRELFGTAWQDTGLVCSHPDGRPIYPDSLTRVFGQLARKFGLRTSLHDCRHTHADSLLRQKVSPKVVQRRLGHADVRTTLSIYAHSLPEDDAEVAELTEQALRRALEGE